MKQVAFTEADLTAKSHFKTRSLLRGRHPRSFPRDSEFWGHYNQSNYRLGRVEKGCSLFETIQHESMFSQSLAKSSLISSDESIAQQETTPLRDKGLQNKSQTAVEGDFIDKTARVKMHYGSNFVIMNVTGEVLCVNEEDQVECKKMNSLLKSDRNIFKIIDINEPSNVGRIHFDGPIWLQVLSDPNSENYSSSWESGYVLGSKVFFAPTATSLQAVEDPDEDVEAVVEVKPIETEKVIINTKTQKRASLASIAEEVVANLNNNNPPPAPTESAPPPVVPKVLSARET